MIAGVALAHITGELTETVGFSLMVNIPEPLPVHELTLVTVTLYVPAEYPLMLAWSPGFDTPAGTVHA